MEKEKKPSLTSIIAWLAVIILIIFLLICGKDIISNENNKQIIVAVLLISGILLITLTNLFSEHLELLLTELFSGFEKRIAQPTRIFFIIFAFIFISVGINRWTEIMNSKNEFKIDKIYNFVLMTEKDEYSKNYGNKLQEIEDKLAKLAKKKVKFNEKPEVLPE